MTKQPHQYGVLVCAPGQEVRQGSLAPVRLSQPPLVSCMMPTRGKLFPARFAIESFRSQAYANRELVIVCKTPDNEVKSYVEALGDPQIRYQDAPEAATLGDLRNLALSLCRGEFVAIWDDDDLHHHFRLAIQMGVIRAARAQACCLRMEVLWWPARRRLSLSRGGIWENSMVAPRRLIPPYPSVDRGEDTEIVKRLFDRCTVVLLDAPSQYVRVYHGGNIWDAAHFERFFAQAQDTFDAEAYEEQLLNLGRAHPLQEYQAELDRLGKGAAAA